MRTKDYFHYISYLQYPLMLVALAYAAKPYFNHFRFSISDVNDMLIFMGLAISFSSLQDTHKTQNRFSKNIWKSPRKGKVAVVIMTLMTLSFIVAGLMGLYVFEETQLQEVAFGLMVLGVGFIGLLKVALEMFENHCQDEERHTPR